MPGTRPTYTATFERTENGTWVADLVEEPNVHGYGATLVEARRNIRDAITSLFGPFEGEADGFELVEDVRLPQAVLAMVERARRERQDAHRRRAEAQAAEDAVAAATRQAMAVTRHAARLLVEHGRLMKGQADNVGLTDDLRLSEELLGAVQQAHEGRVTARAQQRTAEAARVAADASSSEAVVTNRAAVRVLIGQCGLTTAEAAGLLGLSPQRAERLLTA